MPLLVLGFFCLREYRYHTTTFKPSKKNKSNHKHRARPRQHRQRNHRLPARRRRHHSIPIQHRAATPIHRHSSVRSALEHDPLQSRSWQMAVPPTLPLGLVSTFQAFQTNYTGYLVTRFLLGATESGYIPGGLWTVSTWYTRKETAKRIMVFSMGSQLGQASAKLIAYGILHMRGVAGYPGWFWLFLLMGLFTIACGILLGFCLPASLFRPQSWFLPNFSFFTDREIHILRTRVLIDDPRKNWKKKSIGVVTFKRAVSETINICASREGMPDVSV